MLAVPAALEGLAEYDQFILWRAVFDPKAGKNTKRPVDPRTLKTASAHNPDAWVSSSEAVRLAAESGLGVGFVFTEADPFFFVDIDGCLNPDNTWSELALSLIARFPGAAVEVSQSGKGLHIMGRGTVPAHSCKNEPLGLEFYTSDRFVALTGTSATGDSATDHTAALAKLTDDYFKPKEVTREDWRDEPVPEWRGPEMDSQLLQVAMKAKSAASVFGNRASFQDLYYKDEIALGAAFPEPAADRAFNASQADAALAQRLAFYTGKNHGRIERIMRSSELVRDKWEREDYLPRTISRAVNLQKDVMGSHKTASVEKQIEDAPGRELLHPIATSVEPVLKAEGAHLLGWDEALRMFKGCVYIQDIHKVLTPDGAMLKPEQFKATYGGYLYPLDAENSKPTSNAWEALVESRGMQFAKVNGCTFKPLEEPHAILDQEGQKYINVYTPIETPCEPGDVQVFLDHLALLLPDEGDRSILLAYVASLVQNIGTKFQWCILLQGVEGNGKTFISRAVAEIIGHRYSHLPAASDLDNNFNGWMENNIFIGVEDIFVSDARSGVIEALKPMITNERLEITRKGVDQVTRDVCGNFILNSNHKNAIRKTKNDRRFCVLFTGQQSDEDLKRDGMDNAYFSELYAWAKNRNGYAKIHHYLKKYAIPAKYDPALVARAPMTTSTEEAVALSLGSVEEEVLEAIETQTPGFAGGWVSSVALDALIDDLRAGSRVPRKKRREVMQTLGYDYHKALKVGRVNNKLADGTRPRIYIKAGHPCESLTNGAEVATAYQSAQPVPGATGTPGEVFA